MSGDYDVIIIGAGAAGLMCAIEAGKRGRRVWLIDHSEKLAEKIRISGGGRCNFTNLHATPKNYLSENEHFCKSAMSRYTQHDFIKFVESHGIAWHEKTLGQLFCDDSAQQIIDALKSECNHAGVSLQLGVSVSSVDFVNGLYNISSSEGLKRSAALVIATGGLSIPKIGATKFGYDVAKQFGMKVTSLRPALVPLTFTDALLDFCKALSGVSIDAVVKSGNTTFREGLLFTHRGISGPSILQISSYWKEGEHIEINLVPDHNVLQFLKDKKKSAAKMEIQNILSEILPKRLAQSVCELHGAAGRIADISHATLEKLANGINRWQVWPAGSEGYRTAEVTLGGVDTTDLSSKTMESHNHRGLYFIGEVVDVTGHLGGFNFQWAWASGYVAGQYV